jgi:hypothetical protein
VIFLAKDTPSLTIFLLIAMYYHHHPKVASQGFCVFNFQKESESKKSHPQALLPN